MCGSRFAVVTCPWTPDDTDGTTLSGVLIAGITLGVVSLIGIVWLCVRRLFLCFTTARSKQQDLGL